jgi:hypothetical protein
MKLCAPRSLTIKAKPAAWDEWLASRPESENVEDRRPPLVQFPPVIEGRKK